MTVTKPSRAPIGTIPLIGGAFALLFAIVLIAWGIKDIRAGEGASFWFFLGWIVFIAVVVIYYPKLTKRNTPEPKPPTDSTGYDSRLPVLLLLQDTVPPAIPETCDGMASCHPWVVLAVVVAVAAIAIGIWRYNKARP